MAGVEGACSECGSPWERMVEREVKPPPDRVNNNTFKHDAMTTHGEGAATLRNIVEAHTIGWRPTCECDAGEPVPCVVLDPFAGTATVGQVAIQHRRRFVGLDLSHPYLAELASERLAEVEVRLF